MVLNSPFGDGAGDSCFMQEDSTSMLGLQFADQGFYACLLALVCDCKCG